MGWILAIVVIAAIGGGIAYYENSQSTVLQVGVGQHSVSVHTN
jgi:hypothetical protein